MLEEVRRSAGARRTPRRRSTLRNLPTSLIARARTYAQGRRVGRISALQFSRWMVRCHSRDERRRSPWCIFLAVGETVRSPSLGAGPAPPPPMKTLGGRSGPTRPSRTDAPPSPPPFAKRMQHYRREMATIRERSTGKICCEIVWVDNLAKF